MPQRPSRVRYLVVASAFLMSALLYLDRFCISIAEVYIQQDLGLSDEQVGWMLSAFFWTYALGQVPAGWLTDRFGSRLMLTIYILAWSLLTGLTGAAGAFVALLLLRFGFGFAQSGAYPTAASIISKWMPLQARGRASGIIAVGGRVGGFLALSATGYILIWLTPLSTPTELASSDILDGSQVVIELTKQSDPVTAEEALRGRCFAEMNGDVHELVLDHDQHPSKPLASEELSSLAEGLNQIIRHPGFFTAAELKGVSLEKEAKRLIAKPTSELTEQQSQRLNRLVLEALHRKSIKRLYVAGWRPMMFFYGSIGLLVAGLVWWSCRNVPSRHPWCNEEEVALIRGDKRAGDSEDKKLGGVPIGPLLRSRSMWLCCASQWFTNIGWVFLMTWAPRYFLSIHKVSVEELALMVAIPPLVGWAGMLTGGGVTDALVDRIGLRWGRGLPMSLSRFAAMGAYLAVWASPSPWLAVAMFSVVAFATDFGTPSLWAYMQDAGGRHVGSILGWGNMWGNLGAAVTPPLLIWIVGETERWDLAFLTCATAFLLSGLAAAGINATIPIVPDDDDTAEA
ncbi:MAG: MFS transporter [Planctomycetaceae bacterium]|nr:MFS transporter [Planctomycetales bacterium]MCB9921932.1 MFS transporter [Planctomycetaceae bacterium]